MIHCVFPQCSQYTSSILVQQSFYSPIALSIKYKTSVCENSLFVQHLIAPAQSCTTVHNEQLCAWHIHSLGGT
ncbi:hypothetical protein NP493_610g02013 [Ridgeia piscesae]|uniref:Uncharacterized protein n=1 Tax=Ridgeia piscesae TaxID=27915 RepID=A0AAD9KTY7_RIDPI|nr:hypothetical protein NP493_610g02013 [Ridgeia piscesae]